MPKPNITCFIENAFKYYSFYYNSLTNSRDSSYECYVTQHGEKTKQQNLTRKFNYLMTDVINVT
jgi:hypothetical protein